MTEYVIGANILENLTTGMYKDSKVIYREYIQNSCDQIDKAIRNGILREGEGAIKIWLDNEKRVITIEDNATGIPSTSFQRILGNIADSDKKIGEDKGFRGIGRLCGLAYCKEVVFRSSAKGENTISTVICDAKKMRDLIEEHQHGKKHTANEMLHAINRFEEEKTYDVDSHFFRVELIDINNENRDLLNLQEVKDYLSFVAPVPYQNTFIYRTDVYNRAKELGFRIDEYNIKLEGEQVFKKYSTDLKEPTGAKYDDIFGVHFKEFRDADEGLFVWMWVGLSKFKKAIPKANHINQMRGLRLRKDNIQIGGEDSLQKLFKEDRGNSYFVGEVFAVSKDLIPNSQRDYFNENAARVKFECELRKYFNEYLQKLYREGSSINSAYKKIDTYKKKEVEFKEKENASSFVNKEHREREFKIVDESKSEADSAKVEINKIKSKANDLLQKVITRIEDERSKSFIKGDSSYLNIQQQEKVKSLHRANKLSQYNRHEQKLISKIYDLILAATDRETAELIITRIEEGLQ
jgi:molecular chaperone HtpG